MIGIDYSQMYVEEEEIKKQSEEYNKRVKAIHMRFKWVE